MSEKLKIGTIAKTALERAAGQIGPKSRRGGRYKMVVDRTSASRLISPLITALNAASVQQKMSFLEDKIGQQVFSEGMNLMDMARTVGKSGSRLYDTEGVATQNRPIIEKGVYVMPEFTYDIVKIRWSHKTNYRLDIMLFFILS